MFCNTHFMTSAENIPCSKLFSAVFERDSTLSFWSTEICTAFIQMGNREIPFAVLEPFARDEIWSSGRHWYRPLFATEVEQIVSRALLEETAEDEL